MKYLSFCLVLVITLVLSAGSVKTGLPSFGYYPGEMIPDIVLKDAEGNSRNLHDYKGKKVVVNFWATYHAQSRANNVQLYNYLRKNKSDIEFVSVAFDENKNVVERTLMLDKLENISQFYEIRGTSSEVYRGLKLNEGFRSYLIDENGVIIAMNVTPENLKTIL
ncbi:TlpA family protein disulfide reductase [Proteiniphilum sp. UBA5384]|uniref:TlpA family protein disulfide reductase n=1 Tax=Proteiniphilum sp. UBA5384 TaxID=1947279 RepID=UPI0025D29DD1|nr:TlpA disulfide reductase family protein [Proteiniphilum sp. UBA5384]